MDLCFCFRAFLSRRCYVNKQILLSLGRTLHSCPGFVPGREGGGKKRKEKEEKAGIFFDFCGNIRSFPPCFPALFAYFAIRQCRSRNRGNIKNFGYYKIIKH